MTTINDCEQIAVLDQTPGTLHLTMVGVDGSRQKVAVFQIMEYELGVIPLNEDGLEEDYYLELYPVGDGGWGLRKDNDVEDAYVTLEHHA